MRVLLILVVILFTASSVLADDCEYINNNKICWDDGTSITLSWTYAKSTVGAYQIEARDFNWLGSVFLRVARNNTVQEGVVSQGEAYIFNFTNGTDFEGVKIVAEEVSNINPMPANTGTYPGNPLAKITVNQQVAEKKKTPTLNLDISTEGDARTGSRITVDIKTENSGEEDLINTDVSIYFDGLKPAREYDINNGLLSEDTVVAPEIHWENVSKYRLTPYARTIMKDGFYIEVADFSNQSVPISASYNLSTINGTLSNGKSIIFNFTRDGEYRGVKLLGSNFSGGAVELILQFPVKNILKRSYYAILKGHSETIKLSFLIPSSEKKSFTITVNASGKDREGNSYTETGSATISASDTLSIIKRTSNSILGERLYPESYYGVGGIRSTGNMTIVNIRVDNLQSYPVYGVRLTDSIPPSFNFPDDANRTSISWDFDINASDYREFKYVIAAKRQGVYNLPKARLTWKEQGEEVSKESESPRTTVSGPYIGIGRSFNKSDIRIGDVLQVILSIINNGDVPTNITVNESVPSNATFISGRLSFSGFLNPGERADIAYNISLPTAGTLGFKAPEVNSRNRGFEWYAPLPVKNLQILSPAPPALPAFAYTPGAGAEEVPEGISRRIDEKLPWLEGAVSIVTFLFGIFLLLELNRTNRK